MSDRRVVDMMARQYADVLACINMFGDMQTMPNITPAQFEAMRAEVLGKISETRRFLKEAENQVKLLQLPNERNQDETSNY
jgi:hypothetical protein